MLAKLHCNEFSSENVTGAVDASRTELQDADNELQSLGQQLTTGRERYRQLQKECQDAQEILHKEVSL